MPLTENDRALLERCLRRQPFSWHSFVDRFIGLALQVMDHTAELRGLELNDHQRELLCTAMFADVQRDDFVLLRRFDRNSSLSTYLTVLFRRLVGRRLVAMEREMKQNGVGNSRRSAGASDSDSRWN